MNGQITKVFYPNLTRRERRDRMHILLIILLSMLAVSTIVVVGLHHLNRIPSKPPSLFN